MPADVVGAWSPRGRAREGSARSRSGTRPQCCQRGKPVKPSLSTRPFHPGRREAGLAGSWPDSTGPASHPPSPFLQSPSLLAFGRPRAPLIVARTTRTDVRNPSRRRPPRPPPQRGAQGSRDPGHARLRRCVPRRPFPAPTTRGRSDIFPPAADRGVAPLASPVSRARRLASAPSRAPPSPAPPSRRRPRAPPRAPRLNPPPRSFLFAADPNAPPKVAYPWLDPGNPQNWKEEHVRLPAVPNPRFPPPNPAPDARGDRDAGRTPETSRASSDRRAWVGPPADADAARPRVGRRPPNDGSNAESDALAHRSRSSPLSPRDTPRSCSPSSAGGRSSSTAPRRPSRSDRRARREGRRERRGRDGTSEPGTTF